MEEMKTEIESKVRMILQDFRRRNDYPLTKAVPDMMALIQSEPRPPQLREVTGLRKKLIDCLNWIDKSTYWKEDNDIPTEFIVDKYLEQMKGGAK
jgi:hypothetical protein